MSSVVSAFHLVKAYEVRKYGELDKDRLGRVKGEPREREITF